LRSAIIGASGYTGAELLRLLAAHPMLDVVYATGDTQAGTLASSLYPSLAAAYPSLVFAEYDPAEAAKCDVVFLGLPHEASLALVPQLVDKVRLIVDLSAAYRLKDASLYPTWYGFSHDQPELLARAVYGLPELYRDQLAAASLIATPGCYVTAASLALTPLVRAGLIDADESLVGQSVTVAGRPLVIRPPAAIRTVLGETGAQVGIIATPAPAASPAPDAVDFARRGVPHLSFGYGARYCVGAPLARLELNAVFSQLIPRFPTLRLTAPVESLAINTEALGAGLVELPVRW